MNDFEIDNFSAMRIACSVGNDLRNRYGCICLIAAYIALFWLCLPAKIRLYLFLKEVAFFEQSLYFFQIVVEPQSVDADCQLWLSSI